jgi:hypothetical protein
MNKSNTLVQVSISGSAPPYQVNLTPAGPYVINACGSTVVMTLDQASAQAGFKMFGIGFQNQAGESQLSAVVSTTISADDTLTVTDGKTEDGLFEFVLLYQDSNGGCGVYGFDPYIRNEEP